jgi:malonyl CoA-acyl carrier protein transacylase
VVDGQTRALTRAYAKAAVSPATVGYVEAHGTGTALGDVVEMEALGQVFREAGAGRHDCVVGSVKSLIGHTKCAAGLAGLINASLALYHKVLPPTIGIEAPNPKLVELCDGPFRLCTQAQPWLHPHADRPRRAGVSAFGFGGTNFHAVLEAYDRNTGPELAAALPEWPLELLVWEADGPAGLIEAIDRLAASLASGARPALCELSHALIEAHSAARAARSDRAPGATLVVLAGSHDELESNLLRARSAIAEGRATYDHADGVTFALEPAWPRAKVAFLFPGQGAQSPGMLRELAVVFPEVRDAFEEFDQAVRAHGGAAIGPLVFPPPLFDEAAKREAQQALLQTDVAQPALGAACVGMLRLLRGLGCEPDLVAGHSFGELVALHTAGVLSALDLAELALVRGQLMKEAARGAQGAMAALLAGPETVEELIRDIAGAQIANQNGPRQTVIAGDAAVVAQTLELAAARGIAGRLLPVSCAFHTQQVASAREPLGTLARARLRASPDRPVYSNLDARPHPTEPSTIAARLGDHLASPVRFADMIETMYRDGARVFVEVGPGSALSALVASILQQLPHLAVSTDRAASPGLAGLLRAIARLLVSGLPLRLERLTAGRSRRLLDLAQLPAGDLDEPATPSTWLVNGGRARPLTAPEPARLGAATTAAQTRLHHQPADLAAGNGLAWHRGDSAARPSSNGTANAAQVVESREPVQPPRVPEPAHHVGSTRPVGSPVPPAVSPLVSSAPAQPPLRTDPVIESFQRTMQAFLEVQRSTMLAYLGGRGSLAAQPENSGEAVQPRDTPTSPVVTGLSTTIPSPGKALFDPRTRSGAGRENVSRPEAPPAESFDHGDGAPAERNGRVADVTCDASTPASPAGIDRPAVAARLLEIVRDRTGYPIETLDLELDIEADLGIDSIKRVEILGTLREEFPHLTGSAETPEVMDALARARSLKTIIDQMTLRAATSRDMPGRPKADSTHANGRPDLAANAGSLRRLLQAVDAPLLHDRLDLMPGGRIVVTEDGRGVALELASRLEASGIRAERIGGAAWPVDWTSPSAIESVLGGLRARGPISGIVHALPLGQSTQGDLAAPEWSARVDDALKGLFLLAKAAAGDLESAARAGGACLIAATALGGRFASAGSRTSEFFPGHGGVAGLVKTLAREWPTVRCRVVDFAPEDSAHVLAGRLVDEMFADDGWPEVGYDQGSRIRLRAVESPLHHGDTAAAFELKPQDPVLISGGARGITAVVAAELARTWHPTLLILGTTPIPTQDEPAETAALTREAELKAWLNARFRREGKPAGPAEIEAAYQALRRAREVRENLAIFRRTGATVEYAEADVRDHTTLAAVLDGWRARYGDPVGLIHGAGLIKDKLIREKTLGSFEQVLGPKLDGALNLLRLLRPETLQFTVLFSSIAGRFGNVGQADYAAANEILNKLAQWLDRRYSGRAVSVIWGPWSGVGMVAQLERHLDRRGLGMIAPDVGRALICDELRYGRKGDVEIVYSGAMGTLDQPLRREAPVPAAEPTR